MDHSQELSFAKNLAHEAGKVMLKYFNSNNLSLELKPNITPLTLADTEINNLVIKTINEKYPAHTIIGEEGNGGVENSEYEWICDPIDGTVPYSLSIPHSFFSLALYKNKKPLFGILYNPMMNIFLEAIEGGNALMNGKVTRVKGGQIEKGDTVAFVNHRGTKSNVDHTKIMSYFIQNDVFVIADVCNTFLAALMVMGKIKCAFVTPAHVWDRAAVSIILRATGGKMLSPSGEVENIFEKPEKYIIYTNGDVDDFTQKLAKNN